MHSQYTYDTEKWFHSACAIRGLFRANVITELVKQWLKEERDFRQKHQSDYPLRSPGA